VHNKIEHEKHLLRTVVLIKVLVDTRATGCITQQLNIYIYGRLCDLVVRVLGYRSGGPGSIPGTTRFFREKKRKMIVGLERGPLSLVSTTEELLDRKVAAPV
jgi:hypothetical protein